jgi:hypothetical protein
VASFAAAIERSKNEHPKAIGKRRKEIREPGSNANIDR